MILLLITISTVIVSMVVYLKTRKAETHSRDEGGNAYDYPITLELADHTDPTSFTYNVAYAAPSQEMVNSTESE